MEIKTRDLALATAYAVSLIAKQLGLEATARGLDERLAWFEAAETLRHSRRYNASPLHTGGGVYVLNVELKPGQIPEDSYIWITPEEDGDGYLIGGYRSPDADDGVYERNVLQMDLVDAVDRMVKRLNPTRWVLPGEFSAVVHHDRTVEFGFTPAAGSAGYFGKQAWDSETGEEPEDLPEFWRVIAEALLSGEVNTFDWTE